MGKALKPMFEAHGGMMRTAELQREGLYYRKVQFPFDYQVLREQIHMDEDFVYSTFGSEVTVALKERAN